MTILNGYFIIEKVYFKSKKCVNSWYMIPNDFCQLFKLKMLCIYARRFIATITSLFHIAWINRLIYQILLIKNVFKLHLLPRTSLLLQLSLVCFFSKLLSGQHRLTIQQHVATLVPHGPTAKRSQPAEKPRAQEHKLVDRRRCHYYLAYKTPPFPLYSAPTSL